MVVRVHGSALADVGYTEHPGMHMVHTQQLVSAGWSAAVDRGTASNELCTRAHG